MSLLDFSSVDESSWQPAIAFPVLPNQVDETTQIEVRWLPITMVKLTGGREDLGVTADREWLLVSSTKNLLHADRFSSSWVYVVALLERTPEVVRSECRSSAERLGLDPDQLWTALPWIEVAKAALAWGASQWVGPALDWVELLGGQHLVGPELAALAESDRPTDRLKRRAEALLATS